MRLVQDLRGSCEDLCRSQVIVWEETHGQASSRYGKSCQSAFRAREQPTLLHINTREELINALHEAIQIEHGLMLQYLYAALSCKRFPMKGSTIARRRSSGIGREDC